MAPEPRSLEPLEPLLPSGPPLVESNSAKGHVGWSLWLPIATGLLGLLAGAVGGSIIAANRKDTTASQSGFVRRCEGPSEIALVTATGLKPGVELRLALAPRAGNEFFINPSDSSMNVALDGIGENAWRSDETGKLTVLARTDLDLTGIKQAGYALYSVDNINAPVQAGALDVIDCR
jgi:hypothetical protein